MSSPTVLPASALAWHQPQYASEPRSARRALIRGALYLVPLAPALAAADQLARMPWPVPAGTVAIGWSALAGLAYLGRIVAAAAGPAAATRLVLSGFAAVALACPTGLMLAPSGLAAADRALAGAVAMVVFGYAAALAVALVAGGEQVLLSWCAPMLVIAAVGLAGWPVPGGEVAGQLGLLVAMSLPVARLAVAGWWPPGRPARHRHRGPGQGSGHGAGRRSRGQRRPDPRRARPHRARPDRIGLRWLDPSQLRGALRRVLLGAAQAAVVVLAWRAAAGAPGGGLSPVLAPLLVTPAAVELWLSARPARRGADLARSDDPETYQRSRRWRCWLRIGALLPPLLAALALITAAHRLPYRLSTHPDPPALALALAAGLLLAGVVAISWLLADRGRPGLAAVVAAAPVPAALLLTALLLAAGRLRLPGDPLGGAEPLLTATAASLAGAYLAGLILTARLLFDAPTGTG